MALALPAVLRHSDDAASASPMLSDDLRVSRYDSFLSGYLRKSPRRGNSKLSQGSQVAVLPRVKRNTIDSILERSEPESPRSSRDQSPRSPWGSRMASTQLTEGSQESEPRSPRASRISRVNSQLAEVDEKRALELRTMRTLQLKHEMCEVLRRMAFGSKAWQNAEVEKEHIFMEYRGSDREMKLFTDLWWNIDVDRKGYIMMDDLTQFLSKSEDRLCRNFSDRCERAMFDVKRRRQNVGRRAMTVTIMSGRGLRKADINSLSEGGGSDMYCTCAVPQKPLSKITSRYLRNSTAGPVWNFRDVIPAYEAGDSLCFKVWDLDCGKKDDLLGTATLRSEQFLPNGFEGEIRLTDPMGTSSQAYLKVKISPPDLQRASNLSRRRSVVLPMSEQAFDWQRCTREDFMYSIWLGADEEDIAAMNGDFRFWTLQAMRAESPPYLPKRKRKELKENFRYIAGNEESVPYERLVEYGLVDRNMMLELKEKYDADGGGTMEFDEFLEMLCPCGFRATEHSVQVAFENGGAVSRATFKLSPTREFTAWYSEEVLTQLPDDILNLRVTELLL